MQFIVKILDFLVASNVYVSLGVVSLTLLSLDIRQIEHPNLLWFVFCDSFCIQLHKTC